LSEIGVECRFSDLVFIRYLDHVMFNRSSPLAVQPQIREAVGWLVYECECYVTITWDFDAEPPTLKGGDPKASGIVILKSDILQLEKVSPKKLPLQKNSEWHFNSQPNTIDFEYAPKTEERKTQKTQQGAPK
jgi:hypothetical protein